jgi:hypothetical protein
MTAAKSGDFTERDDGTVQVGDFILEKGDFELVYQPGDSNYDIEAGF